MEGCKALLKGPGRIRRVRTIRKYDRLPENGGREVGMKLIIGGYAQGKLGYVLRQINPEGWTILDGNSLESPLSDMEHEGHRIVFNHFHSWVKECMK